MKVFEDYFSEIQTDMISISLEYVDEKAEQVYIYCSYEPAMYYFDVFYKINGEIVQRHELNKVTSNYTYDVSIDRQRSLMKIGVKNLKRVHEKCKEFNKEMPTEIKLIYDVKTNKLSGSYSYELKYSNDEDILPSDIFEGWYEEEKNR